MDNEMILAAVTTIVAALAVFVSYNLGRIRGYSDATVEE